MRHLKLFSFHQVIFLLLCLFIACKQNPNTVLAPNSTCPQDLLTQYHQTVLLGASDSLQFTQIVSLIKNTPPTCLDIAIDSFSKKISGLWYNNPQLNAQVIELYSFIGNNRAYSHTVKAKAFLALSSIFSKQKKLADTDSALALAVKDSAGFNSNMWMSYYNRLGLNYFYQNKMKEATELFTKGIALGEKEHSTNIALSNLYTNVGTLYNQIGDAKNAIDIFKKNIQFIESTTNDINSITDNLSNIGTVYGAVLEQFDSAIAYYEKGLVVQQRNKAHDNQDPVFTLLINIASIFKDRKQYDSARYYQAFAAPLFKEIKDPVAQLTFTMNEAVVYAQVRDVSKEVATIKSFLPDFYKDNNLECLQNAYMDLALVCKLQHQYAAALAYHTTLDSIAETMSSDKNKQIIHEMNVKYETAKKDLQLKEQQQAIAKKELLIGSLLALLIVGILASVLYTTLQKLKERKKETIRQQQFTTQLIAQTEEERSRIAQDLHDGVSQELMLLKENTHSAGAVVTQKIESIIQEIRNIARNLRPEMLDKIGLSKSVEYLCEQMMEAHQIFISTNISFNEPISKETDLQLFRIIQESLTNVIKYAQADAVNVSITQKNNSIQVAIKDNGKGFPVTETLASGKSFGLHSIIQRAKAIKGEAFITSSLQGTIIKIDLPLTTIKI